MTHILRALLALGLLVGFYLLALAVAVTLGLLGYAFLVQGTSGWALLVPFLLCLAAGWVVLVVLLASFRAGRRSPAGIQMSPEAQPELWSRLHALAEEVGSRPPDEVRLGPEVEVSLAESPRLLGLASGTRRLTIGVPLLLGLTRGRLTALLAHELGHASGRPTGLAVTTHRGGEALRSVLAELGGSSPAGRLFGRYVHVYFVLAGGMIRRQELEADETSARVAGRNVALAALRELAPLREGWDVYRSEYVEPAYPVGLRPRGFAEGFLDFLDDPGRQAQLAVVRERPEGVPPGSNQSHPPISRRVALLRALIERGPEDDPLPGFAVLSEPDATMAAFFATVYREESVLEPADWEQIGSAVSLHEVEGRARALVQAMLTAPWRRGRAVTFESVATELRGGRGAALAGRATDAQGNAEQRRMAGVLVGSLLGATLVTRGIAAYHLDWSDRTGRLLDRSGDAVDAVTLGHRAVGSEQGVLDLLAFTESHGIAPTDVLEVAGVSAAEPESARVLGCLAPVRHGLRWVVAIPCSDGLAVVRPQGLTELATLGAVVVAVETARTFAGLVQQAPLAAALERPGSELFTWDDIASARLSERFLRRPLLTLRTRSGATCRLGMLRLTDTFGDPWDPWDVMHHFLGERFEVHTPAAERRTGSRVGVLEP